MAFRLDRGTLRSPRKLSGGRLRVDAYITRSGVFVYRNADGSARREYRPPSEVFHADAIESFALAPVTNNHPAGSVKAENAKLVTVGQLGETLRQDGDHLAATIVINDAGAIADIQAGKGEVSSGYNCDLENTAGVTPDGQPYDCIQRNIRGDHVALVDKGRAGPTVAIRMDAGEYEPPTDAQPEIKNMDELKKNLDKALADLAVETARADKAEAERDANKVAADKLEAERDAEKVRADAAEKLHKDSADGFDARVNARVELCRKGAEILGDDYKADATDREIMVAVVERVDSAEIADDKSDDYVQARYDAAAERFKVGSKSNAATNEVAKKRADGKDEILSESAARDAMIARQNKRYEDALK